MVLKRGSNGEDVRQLQQSLQNLGYYNGKIDGGYGEYTEKAVKKYQLDNGGKGDGIAGDWTLNKLGMSKVSNNAPMFAPNTSTAYTTAMSTLNKLNKSKPTYNDAYGGQLKDLYEQIVGRDKFSYDINADALYEQYAQQYADMGRMAMKDTMGQAAGLTGGYGSSYAESVGQQQYDAYLQRLNDVVPELEERAYGRWQDEGNALMQQYSMLGDLSDRDYGRYQDQLNLWLNEKQLAQGAADTAWDRSWNEWQTKLNQLNNEEQLKLQKEAAKKAGSSSSSGRYSGGGDTTSTQNPRLGGTGAETNSKYTSYNNDTVAMRRTVNSIMQSYQTGQRGGEYLRTSQGSAYMVAKLHELYPNASDEDIEGVMKSFGIDVDAYKK